MPDKSLQIGSMGDKTATCACAVLGSKGSGLMFHQGSLSGSPCPASRTGLRLILDGVLTKYTRATLRLYKWRKQSLALGVSQMCEI